MGNWAVARSMNPSANWRRVVFLAAVSLASGELACVHGAMTSGGRLKPGTAASPSTRLAAIRHAQVWKPTKIASMDLRSGPPGPGAYAPGELVSCKYENKPSKGRSPKFICSVSEKDSVKVKYGPSNGEVYAEVAATRLLWALGFLADRMYPVRVECHGCPPELRGSPRQDAPPMLVDPASIERKADGWPIETREDSGWAWPELDLVDESAGGAPREHRDALKLLATLIQHTDSKPAQQRLICVSPQSGHQEDTCAQPFMMLNDLGLTFGHANRLNRNGLGSTNFEGWSRVPVWADPARCVANIDKSLTGTLDHPVIGEAGRRFLAKLLVQLSDTQLSDLFDVARFPKRSAHGVDEWVAAFKHKRDEVVNHTCPQ